MFGLEASFYRTIYKEQKYGREKKKYKTAEVCIINKQTLVEFLRSYTSDTLHYGTAQR